MSTNTAAPTSEEIASRKGAYAVALGIFLSRIVGLFRQTLFAHYFGSSDAADAFNAAYRIPNFLQNLFGEGVLSASFIPVYAKLLAQGDEKEATRLAGAIGSLLALCTSILVFIGVVATPWLIDLIAPGFHDEKRALTIRLVQILFPGTGLLVMSAWCLGILNSHRKFFLSYAAPVIWNGAIIGALLIYGGRSAQEDLAQTTSWGLVLGSLLQFLTQFPVAVNLIKKLQLNLNMKLPSVHQVLKNFTPIVIARGVVQVSAYIDTLLASFLPTGAVSNLAYAQLLYLLPVSLFGMSVSAANLPIMSGAVGNQEQIAASLRRQLEAGLQQIAYFIVPSAVGFLLLGDVMIGAIFQTGHFHHQETMRVWAILAGATVGLLATTMARLYSSTFYALQDTRTPLRCAVVRVALVTILGYIFGLHLPGWLHIDANWGAPGLTLSAGLSGWVEFFMLRRYLHKKIGEIQSRRRDILTLWAAAFAAASLAWAIKLLIPTLPRILAAVLILTPYGLTYLGITTYLKMGEAKALSRRFGGLLKKR